MNVAFQFLLLFRKLSRKSYLKSVAGRNEKETDAVGRDTLSAAGH